jgi:hypothetical protein
MKIPTASQLPTAMYRAPLCTYTSKKWDGWRVLFIHFAFCRQNVQRNYGMEMTVKKIETGERLNTTSQTFIASKHQIRIKRVLNARKVRLREPRYTALK